MPERVRSSCPSGTVGAVLPTIDNAILAQAIDVLRRRLADAGLHLLIATSGHDLDTEAPQAVTLGTRGADALVRCDTGQRAALLQCLHVNCRPCVR